MRLCPYKGHGKIAFLAAFKHIYEAVIINIADNPCTCSVKAVFPVIMHAQQRPSVRRLGITYKGVFRGDHHTAGLALLVRVNKLINTPVNPCIFHQIAVKVRNILLQICLFQRFNIIAVRRGVCNGVPRQIALVQIYNVLRVVAYRFVVRRVLRAPGAV